MQRWLTRDLSQLKMTKRSGSLRRPSSLEVSHGDFKLQRRIVFGDSTLSRSMVLSLDKLQMGRASETEEHSYYGVTWFGSICGCASYEMGSGPRLRLVGCTKLTDRLTQLVIIRVRQLKSHFTECELKGPCHLHHRRANDPRLWSAPPPSQVHQHPMRPCPPICAEHSPSPS